MAILYNAGSFLSTFSGFNLVKYGVTTSSVTNQAGNIYFALTVAGLTGCICKPYTNALINVNQLSKIRITFSSDAYHINNTDPHIIEFCLYPSIPTAADSDAPGIRGVTPQWLTTAGTFTLNTFADIDVTGLNGDYYLGGWLRVGYGAGSYENVYITKIETIPLVTSNGNFLAFF